MSFYYGAEETRTPTDPRPADFESAAYHSATPAAPIFLSYMKGDVSRIFQFRLFKWMATVVKNTLGQCVKKDNCRVVLL